MSERDYISELFERTEPSFFSDDSERIRDGVWRRVRRHRTIVKARVAIAAVAVIIIAVLVTLKTSQTTAVNDWDIAIMTDDELMQEASKLPQVELVNEIIGSEAEAIEVALLTEADINEVIQTLSEDEQEELLLALNEIQFTSQN